MARLARIVVPGLPHHITQRGNRQQPIFFEEGDYALYLRLLAEQCEIASVKVWAYCLMPNHVHLVLVPQTETGLRRAVAETHRRYSAFINRRTETTGHLFQGRFSSVVMDEDNLRAALRYVSLNPVRAKLVERAEDWPWSSVRAHLAGWDDDLVEVAPALARYPDFAAMLDTPADDVEAFAPLRASENTGRPLGAPAFLVNLEQQLGRVIRPAKRGRKAASKDIR
jgi:putative transposase